MTGALLGMLVELSQLEPVFADPSERPEDALARHLPLLVIVTDGDIDAFKSDLFIARAQHRGIGVVVFGRHSNSTSAWAKERGLPYLELPTDAEAFGRILDQAMRQDRRSRLVGDRRRPPHTEKSADGTLILQAESGERWYVYDRRAGERRGAGQQQLSESYRAFVNQEGVELRVALEPHEFMEKTPDALQQQLARAR